jgi:hypothetical protein
MAMKLNSVLVERTLGQFKAQAIPDGHPVLTQLNKLFGDHTFLLNSGGLHIVEPTKAAEPGEQAAKVVKLASWEEDSDGTRLIPHEPEATNVVVVLEPPKRGSGTKE